MEMREKCEKFQPSSMFRSELMQKFFQPSSMLRAELMQKNIFSQRVCEELK
jgi:hypothetical protein